MLVIGVDVLVLVLVVLAGEGVEELFYEAGHFGRSVVWIEV